MVPGSSLRERLIHPIEEIGVQGFIAEQVIEQSIMVQGHIGICVLYIAV